MRLRAKALVEAEAAIVADALLPLAAVVVFDIVAAAAAAAAAEAEAAERRRTAAAEEERKARREAGNPGEGPFDLAAAPERLEGREGAFRSMWRWRKPPCARWLEGEGIEKERKEKVRSSRSVSLRRRRNGFAFLFLPFSSSFPSTRCVFSLFPVHLLVWKGPRPIIVEAACAIKAARLAGRRRENVFFLLQLSQFVAPSFPSSTLRRLLSGVSLSRDIMEEEQG